jgi:hypothetical protein
MSPFSLGDARQETAFGTPAAGEDKRQQGSGLIARRSLHRNVQ